MYTFKNKTVLITGASSGIGRALAIKLGHEGTNLGIIARREERLVEVADLSGGKARVEVLAGDVGDESFCRHAIERVANRFGGIDWIVANAGLSMNALLEDTDLAVFHRLMQVNYFGALHFAKFGLPHLEHTRGGLILVSSILGKRGLPTRSGYAASKFALHALFESLRSEWAKKGVHVGIVAPGYTDTEIRDHALGPDGAPCREAARTRGEVMSAEAVADAILRAARRKQREVVLTAAGRTLIWANKLAPRLVDWIAEREFSTKRRENTEQK